MNEQAESTTETLILVGRRYSSERVSDGAWSRWRDKTFEDAVAAAVERVRDGKASSCGIEVIEVTITRRVLVKPRIEAVDVVDTAGEKSPA